MKKNMGALDRGLRLAAAVIIAILYLAGSISGVTAIVLGLIAIVFLVTSLFSFCPLYLLLGLSTDSKKSQ